MNKVIDVDDYLARYLELEDALRGHYGDFTYFSRPAIYESENGIIAVTPWAEYSGEPLILPHPNYVKFISITTINDKGDAETSVRLLQDVLNCIKNRVEVVEAIAPVLHISVALFDDDDLREQLRELVDKLPSPQVTS